MSRTKRVLKGSKFCLSTCKTLRGVWTRLTYQPVGTQYDKYTSHHLLMWSTVPVPVSESFPDFMTFTVNPPCPPRNGLDGTSPYVSSIDRTPTIPLSSQWLLRPPGQNSFFLWVNNKVSRHPVLRPVPH